MRFAFAAEPLNRPPGSLALGPAFSSQATFCALRFADALREPAKTKRADPRGPALQAFYGGSRPPCQGSARSDGHSRCRPRGRSTGLEALADRQGAQAAAAARGSGRLARAFKRPACLDRSPSCRKTRPPYDRGEVAEWLNAPHSKFCFCRHRQSRRIPQHVAQQTFLVNTLSIYLAEYRLVPGSWVAKR